MDCCYISTDELRCIIEFIPMEDMCNLMLTNKEFYKIISSLWNYFLKRDFNMATITPKDTYKQYYPVLSHVIKNHNTITKSITIDKIIRFMEFVCVNSTYYRSHDATPVIGYTLDAMMLLCKICGADTDLYTSIRYDLYNVAGVSAIIYENDIINSFYVLTNNTLDYISTIEENVKKYDIVSIKCILNDQKIVIGNEYMKFYKSNIQNLQSISQLKKVLTKILNKLTPIVYSKNYSLVCKNVLYNMNEVDTYHNLNTIYPCSRKDINDVFGNLCYKIQRKRIKEIKSSI